MIVMSDIKSELKDVLRDKLEKRVSELFLEQSLAIIDQSANSKESFAFAVERISRRVALFIDTELAQTVHENLMALIGTSASPQGTKRRYPRVDFFHTVTVQHKGKQYMLPADNISEGGIFIKTEKTLPINSEIEMMLYLDPGSGIAIKGIVVNKRSFFRGSQPINGMGIEFKDIDRETAVLLRNYTQKLYTE